MIADGLRLAVGTFTAVPVRAPEKIDRSAARTAMILAPVASLPIGVVATLVGVLGAGAQLPRLVTAALLICGVALGSRGLHLDGLADTADGLTASYDRTRALQIMRLGNIGPIGVVAVVLVLTIQIAATADVLSHSWGAVVVGILVCLSRGSLLVLCAAGVPSARTDGLGAAVAGVVPRTAGAMGLMAMAVIAGALLTLLGSPWWSGAVVVALAVVVWLALLFRCRRRFGGITGDVLGAGIELGLATLLVAASAGS